METLLNEVPVWDGNTTNLPAENKVFLYGDQKYLWRTCTCSCNLPNGFRVGETEEYNFGMTVRLRGNVQGNSMIDVIVKLGKIEELIATNGDFESCARLLNDTLDEIGIPTMINFPKKLAFLASKGIHPLEMYFALNECLGIPEGVALMMLC